MKAETDDAVREFNNRCYDEMMQGIRNGDGETVIDAVLICKALRESVFVSPGYYYIMPKDLQRQVAIACYAFGGDNMPACRQAVRKLERKGKEELPEEYRDKEWITVYRAGAEDVNRAQYKLSWSLSREALKPFIGFKRDILMQDVKIYQAKIRPEDVIAYTNDREEQEVLQYRKVKDIREIA